MTEISQSERERFWLALGAKKDANNDRHYLGKCHLMNLSENVWLNPGDEENIPLDVLLDGLERLTGGKAFISKSSGSFFVYPQLVEWHEYAHLAFSSDRREAIILAIQKLIEEKEKFDV